MMPHILAFSSSSYIHLRYIHLFDEPDFLHRMFGIDKPQYAYRDGNAALLHSQLMLKGPKEPIQGKFCRGIWRHQGTAHFTCETQTTEQNTVFPPLKLSS